MQVVVNEKLVRSKVRLAWLFHLGALIVYGFGLYLSSTQADQASFESTGLLIGAIAAGLFLYSLGQAPLRRWGPRYRQDAALAKALKGLDSRFTLLAFPSPALPDYILVAPAGVQVLVPRSHGGVISCQNDVWRREGRGGLGRVFSFFGRTPLGNPGYEVAQGIARVRERLRAAGLQGDGEPPVNGLVVFTNPAVKLRIDGCSATVTGPKQLRNHVRGVKGPLNQQAVARVVQALQA